MENQILKDGMFVIAPKIDIIHYLTPAKKYQVFNVEEASKPYLYSFNIINDIGTKSGCLLNNCGHLLGGNWIIDTEPTEQQSKNHPNYLNRVYQASQALENSFCANQILKLKFLADDTPNDMELVGIIRKMLNEIEE